MTGITPFAADCDILNEDEVTGSSQKRNAPVQRRDLAGRPERRHYSTAIGELRHVDQIRVCRLVLATALATTTYAASKSSGGSQGGGSHGGVSHGGSSHGGGSHASHGGGGHGGGHAAHGGHGGRHGHAGHGGKAHAGFAGAFRNPLFWLYWPFAYYAGPDQLALTCGEDVSDIANMPLDQFRDAIHPTDELAAALDDLGLAVMKAAQDIKIACPAEMPLTAPGRMAAMQRRIEAMIAAVEIVQPALEKFYGLLNDEQKARVNALASAARQSLPAKSLREAADNCGPSQLSGMELPAAEIDKAVHLTDPERTESGRVAEHRHPGGGGSAESLLRSGTCDHAAGTARRGPQAARRYARRRQDGRRFAQRFLWHAVRRAEGEVRSDRPSR